MPQGVYADMNMIDIVILLLFAFFLLAGWYRGFLNTLLSLGAYIFSSGMAFLLRAPLAEWVKGNEALYTTALYYTEGAEFINNTELARTNISAISAEQLNSVIEQAHLPIPIDTRITENIAKEVFAKDGISTLGDYFNQTIVNVFVNIACVLILFVIIRLVLAFVIHMVDYARNGLPVLHTADGLLGACFGLIRGFLAIYILFLLIPIVLIILPKIGDYLTDSFFGNFFYNSNFLLRFIPGL